MIQNEQELKATLNRIERFQKQVEKLQQVETNPRNSVDIPETISNIILEETVKKYSIAIIESWLRSPHSPQEHILEALEIRFGADAAQTFKPALDAIDGLQHLEQLHRAAILAENVEDFQRALKGNEVEGFLEHRKHTMPQYSEAYPRAKIKTS